MNCSVLIYVYIILVWLTRTSLQLKCFAPCKYRANITYHFDEPQYCSNESSSAKVCTVQLEFDYKNQYIYIFRDSRQQLPQGFNKKIQIHTVLRTTIDFNHNHVHHNFSHYCSMDTYCAKKFLTDTVDQYRLQSYTTLIEKLRVLLRLNSLLPTPLSTIYCLKRDGTPTKCSEGRCYASESPFTNATRRGCALRNFSFPSPLIITVPNMNYWAEFSFVFECYWTLCNNKSLVDTIYDLIRINLYSWMTTTTTTTTMVSRTIYTNKPIKIITTKHTAIGTATNTGIDLNASNRQIILSVAMILYLSPSCTLFIYSY